MDQQDTTMNPVAVQDTTQEPQESNLQVPASMPQTQQVHDLTSDTNDSQVAATAQTPEVETNYVINVGQAMVDLLTEVSMSDTKKQLISTEMGLPLDQVTSLCTSLLDKYDSGALTEAELAFLMAAPVADSVSPETSSTT